MEKIRLIKMITWGLLFVTTLVSFIASLMSKYSIIKPMAYIDLILAVAIVVELLVEREIKKKDDGKDEE